MRISLFWGDTVFIQYTLVPVGQTAFGGNGQPTVGGVTVSADFQCAVPVILRTRLARGGTVSSITPHKR